MAAGLDEERPRSHCRVAHFQVQDLSRAWWPVVFPAQSSENRLKRRPHDRLGERVCLAILGTTEADVVLQHLADEGLSKYDMPEYFVRMADFPLTASGKILKRELVEMVRRNDLAVEPCRYTPRKESA